MKEILWGEFNYKESTVDSKQLVDELIKIFGFSWEEVEEQFTYYNGDIFAYDNKVYNNVLTRIVQLINNVNLNSWNIERQNFLCEYFSNIKDSKVIDAGYGVPGRHILHLLNNNNQITLLDKYKSSKNLSKVFLDIVCNDWSSRIELKTGDLENYKGYSQFDHIIFFDSIEHISNPTEVLKEIVQSLESETVLLFSLPVCPLIPSHHISWSSKEEIISWVSSFNLDVLKATTVYPNLQGDLFYNFIGEECCAINIVAKLKY